MRLIQVCLVIITCCQLYSFFTGLVVGVTVRNLYKEIKPLLKKIGTVIKVYVPDTPEETIQ